jgi:alpha-tubulin suppressor-like RCC1 family protein
VLGKLKISDGLSSRILRLAASMGLTVLIAPMFIILGPSAKASAGTIPGVPVDVVEVSHTSSSVSVQWSVPVSDGGDAISDYQVQFRSPIGVWTTFNDGVSTATTATVTGLTRGTPYNFRVAAVNANGPGAYALLDPLTGISLGRHSCGITSRQTVVCWGLNTVGQLGVPPSDIRYQQIEVEGLSGVTQLEVGLNHTCAVISNGTVKCWGSNEVGQLGNGTTSSWSTPVQVSGLTGVVQVTSGFKFSCARKLDATVHCWGLNNWNQLGNSGGSTANLSSPIQVAGITDAVQVEAGYEFACIRKSNGQVRCWGNSNNTAGGRLIYAPGGLSYMSNVSQISANPESRAACAVNGSTLCWGYGWGSSSMGAYVSGLINATVSVSVSVDSICAVTAAGSVRICGNNEVLVGSAVVDVVDVVAGYFSYCAMNSLTTYCWGDNNNGQQAAPVSVDDSSDVAAPREFISARRVTPTGLAGAPTNIAETHEATAVSLMWTAPVDTGTLPIFDYLVEYRATGSSTWSPFEDGVNSQTGATVSGLTKGTQYDFRISAITQDGTGTPSSTISTYAASNPGVVTGLTSPSHTETSASLSWLAPVDNGGRTITDYVIEYKTVAATVWLTFADGVSSLTSATVTGLTRSTSYNFRVTSKTANGLSSSVQLASAVTAATVPAAPTLVSISRPVTGSALSVVYSANDNGGLPINLLQYRLDGGNWTSGACCTSPLLITGLTNGVTYLVEIRLGNSDGYSSASPSSSGTPAAVPMAPTISSISKPTTGGQLSVAFTSGLSNGAAISTYEYSLNGGASWVLRSDGGNATSPILISSLTNGTSYSIRVRAVNAQGSGASSSTVTAFPATTPGAPSISRIESASSSIGIVFSAPASNGGAVITNYEFSVDGGLSWTTRTPASTSSPWTIGGLVDGTTYSVQLRAVNGQGPGNVSVAASGTPASMPSNPLITSVDIPAVGRSLWVNFSAPSNDGGSTIVTYQYSINGGASWLSRTDGQTTSSPLKISGLTNGTSYSISIRATNIRGAGISSPVETGIPAGRPSAPTISDVDAPIDGESLIVYFDPGSSQGSEIFDFQYSLDGGVQWYSRDDGGTTESPLIIEGLTNGNQYRIALRAENSQGISDSSTIVNATPATTPDRPVIESVTTGNGSLTVKVGVGGDGGAPILMYQVSVNAGVTWTSWVASTRTRIVYGLTMGDDYTVLIRAINEQGVSDDSLPQVVRLGNPPVAKAGGAQDVGQTTARLTGSVTANFVTTVVSYEISTKNDFSTILRSLSGKVSNSGDATSVFLDVTDLPEGAVLYYRIIAENRLGKSVSDAVTFTTFAPLGVSIEDGAVYTDSASVSVYLSWPRGATAVILSNDGGFKVSSRLPLSTLVSWKLQSSGSERLPKVIYVRYVLANGSRSETYQDDIILDETDPTLGTVNAARVSGTTVNALSVFGAKISLKKPSVRMNVSASDANSGLDRIEIKGGGKTLKFTVSPKTKKSVLTVTTSRTSVQVRSVDRAGNVSKWKTVKIPK